MELTKAVRKKSKIRINISAPSGAGKTMSALLLAKGIVGSWDKIAVIDSENGSASLYSHLGDFFTIELTPPFSPERYIQAIKTCIDANIECIIVDSTSPEWAGIGGCLEINDKLAAAKYRGNSWSAWSDTNPRHDAFVATLINCNAHVICCTRSKMETVMGDDKKVKKVGMKDIQRDGWEYEFSISFNLDRESHMCLVSKDRTTMFEGREPFVITEKTGIQIKEWCESGVENPIASAKADLRSLLGSALFNEKVRSQYETWLLSPSLTAEQIRQQCEKVKTELERLATAQPQKPAIGNEAPVLEQSTKQPETQKSESIASNQEAPVKSEELFDDM